MNKKLDIKPGKKYGRWTVIEYDEEKSKEKKCSYYKCQCSCENKTIRSIRGTILNKNKSISCGCLTSEKNKILSTKHSMYGTRIYQIWQGMKHRCNYEKSPNYIYYGGRGIIYDQKWETFEGIFEDMGQSYFDNGTIDRIDVNGNYTKENCKWVSLKEQGENRRNNKKIYLDNEEIILTKYLTNIGITNNVETYKNRILDLKWDIQDAIKIPIGWSRLKYYFLQSLINEFKNKKELYSINKKEYKLKYNFTNGQFRNLIKDNDIKQFLYINNIINELYKLTKKIGDIHVTTK